MRILQIHTHYRQPGGEDAVVTAESRLLRSAGHVVTEWRNRNPEQPVATIAALAVGAWNRSTAARFAIETHGNHDVAHVHNTWFATTPSVLGELERRSTPIVMTLHNYRLTCANALLLRNGSPCELCIGSHPWHAVRHACYRGSRAQSLFAAGAIAANRRSGAWERVDRFLALTGFARQKMIEAGLDPSRIVVKPNFVADPGVRPAPPSASNRVLFVGRLAPEKGVRTLVDAWNTSDTGDLELTIAGDGPLAAELAGVAGVGVHLVGRLDTDEVRRLMLDSRALVFPSEWYEGMPMTMLEALAAGLPVLASELGSMTEIVSPLGRSWLTPPADVSALGRALRGLATADVDAAGARARGLWRDHYSPEVALDALLDAYRF
jgi:glycosyltransferase involved in cell wall biosynthesis